MTIVQPDIPMQLNYLVCYDGQHPTAWVLYDNPAPLTGTSTGSIPLDDPDILAATETLLALVASKQGLTRTPTP